MSAEQVLMCLWGWGGGLKGVSEHWTGWGYTKKTEHVCRARDQPCEDNQETPTLYKEEISPKSDQEALWYGLRPTGGPCSITEATLGLCAVLQGTSTTACPNARPQQKVNFTGVCTWGQQGVLVCSKKHQVPMRPVSSSLHVWRFQQKCSKRERTDWCLSPWEGWGKRVLERSTLVFRPCQNRPSGCQNSQNFGLSRRPLDFFFFCRWMDRD